MSRRLRVKLDLAALSAHLAREEGKNVSREETIAWLKDAGFAQLDDGRWAVSEKDLGQVDPSEVLEIESLDD